VGLASIDDPTLSSRYRAIMAKAPFINVPS
jgi:hypothetical protein